jgi:CRISPR-associated protein Cas2
MVLERAPASLRGELNRWMVEVRRGVFVGTLRQSVRELLWQKACSGMPGGTGILAYPAGNEQGFAVDLWGYTFVRYHAG